MSNSEQISLEDFAPRNPNADEWIDVDADTRIRVIRWGIPLTLGTFSKPPSVPFAYEFMLEHMGDTIHVVISSDQPHSARIPHCDIFNLTTGHHEGGTGLLGRMSTVIDAVHCAKAEHLSPGTPHAMNAYFGVQTEEYRKALASCKRLHFLDPDWEECVEDYILQLCQKYGHSSQYETVSDAPSEEYVAEFEAAPEVHVSIRNYGIKAARGLFRKYRYKTLGYEAVVRYKSEKWIVMTSPSLAIGPDLLVSRKHGVYAAASASVAFASLKKYLEEKEGIRFPKACAALTWCGFAHPDYHEFCDSAPVVQGAELEQRIEECKRRVAELIDGLTNITDEQSKRTKNSQGEESVQTARPTSSHRAMDFDQNAHGNSTTAGLEDSDMSDGSVATHYSEYDSDNVSFGSAMDMGSSDESDDGINMGEDVPLTVENMLSNDEVSVSSQFYKQELQIGENEAEILARLMQIHRERRHVKYLLSVSRTDTDPSLITDDVDDPMVTETDLAQAPQVQHHVAGSSTGQEGMVPTGGSPQVSRSRLDLNDWSVTTGDAAEEASQLSIGDVVEEVNPQPVAQSCADGADSPLTDNCADIQNAVEKSCMDQQAVADCVVVNTEQDVATENVGEAVSVEKGIPVPPEAIPNDDDTQAIPHHDAQTEEQVAAAMNDETDVMPAPQTVEDKDTEAADDYLNALPRGTTLDDLRGVSLAAVAGSQGSDTSDGEGEPDDGEPVPNIAETHHHSSAPEAAATPIENDHHSNTSESSKAYTEPEEPAAIEVNHNTQTSQDADSNVLDFVACTPVMDFASFEKVKSVIDTNRALTKALPNQVHIPVAASVSLPPVYLVQPNSTCHVVSGSTGFLMSSLTLEAGTDACRSTRTMLLLIGRNTNSTGSSVDAVDEEIGPLDKVCWTRGWADPKSGIGVIVSCIQTYDVDGACTVGRLMFRVRRHGSTDILQYCVETGMYAPLKMISMIFHHDDDHPGQIESTAWFVTRGGIAQFSVVFQTDGNEVDVPDDFFETVDVADIKAAIEQAGDAVIQDSAMVNQFFAICVAGSDSTTEWHSSKSMEGLVVLVSPSSASLVRIAYIDPSERHVLALCRFQDEQTFKLLRVPILDSGKTTPTVLSTYSCPYVFGFCCPSRVVSALQQYLRLIDPYRAAQSICNVKLVRGDPLNEATHFVAWTSIGSVYVYVLTKSDPVSSKAFGRTIHDVDVDHRSGQLIVLDEMNLTITPIL